MKFAYTKPPRKSGGFAYAAPTGFELRLRQNCLMPSYASRCHRMALTLDRQVIESIGRAMLMTLNDAGILAHISL